MPTSTILLHESPSELPFHIEVHLGFTLSDFSGICTREGGSLSLGVFPFFSSLLRCRRSGSRSVPQILHLILTLYKHWLCDSERRSGNTVSLGRSTPLSPLLSLPDRHTLKGSAFRDVVTRHVMQYAIFPPLLGLQC